MVETRSDRRDRPGDGNIVIQRLGLINQHIGARGGEALVESHVIARHALAGASPITGTGLAGSLRYSSKPCRRRIACQLQFPIRRQMQASAATASLGGHGRSVATDSCRSRKTTLSGTSDREAFSPSPLSFRSRTKNGNSICSRQELAGLRSEVQIAERVAVAARPSAMPPGSHDQSVRAIAVRRLSLRETVSTGPERSSASNQPPTNSDGRRRCSSCAAPCARDCQ